MMLTVPGVRMALFACVLSLLAIARPAEAAVYSDAQVTFQYYYNGGAYDFGSVDSVGGSRTTFSVPGGTVFAPNFVIEVTPSQIRYRFTGDSQWQNSITSVTVGNLAIGNGPVIESTSLSIPIIVGVQIDQASLVPGTFSMANVGYDSRSVGVSWGGQNFSPGDLLILDVQGFSLYDSVQPVPEPASFVLLALGLCATLVLRHRS